MLPPSTATRTCPNSSRPRTISTVIVDFWEAWDRGGPAWHRVESPATENPRITPEQLEEEREMMGAAYFEQEFLCKFVDNGTRVFQSELIEQALDEFVTEIVFE